MINIKVLIYYPSGNTTALIEEKVARKLQTKLAKKIMDDKIAEQVIFLEKPSDKKAVARLQMMGGEFSGNATLVFAKYLLDRNKSDNLYFESSGINELVKATRLKNNLIQTTFASNINLNYVTLEGSYWTIPLPGIFQIVIPNKKPGKNMINMLVAKYQNMDKALVLIFVKEQKNRLKITPVVWVAETKSLVYETACGSGSIAVAIWKLYASGRNKKLYAITQPTNKTICVKLQTEGNFVRKISLITAVKLLKEITIAQV
jgi:diaminopimelate epimerase